MKNYLHFEMKMCRTLLIIICIFIHHRSLAVLYIQQFLLQLSPALNSSSTGIFADSCLIHCQTLQDLPWATYTVGGQTMRESFEDWYFEKTSAKSHEIDCAFPCNPTCPVPKQNSVFYTPKELSFNYSLF